MSNTFVVDWEVAGEVLTDTERIILQTLVAKIKGIFDDDELEVYEDENDYRNKCGLPPLSLYKVYTYTGSGSRTYISHIAATDDSDAVTRWYSAHSLKGKLTFNFTKNYWQLDQNKIHLEKE